MHREVLYGSGSQPDLAFESPGGFLISLPEFLIQ